jgi:sugar-specific transcriptional regulator TrmB
MVVTNLIDELASLGLSGYEAKTYIAMLEQGGSLTAYEAARASGIPTSKIYGVMDRLVERGIAHQVEAGGTNRYEPLDPSEFIAAHRYKMESSLTRLSKGLSSLGGKSHRSTIFTMSDYDMLIDKASRMIQGARTSVLVSAWKEEFNQLAPLVANAQKRKVRAAVVHFGKPDVQSGQFFLHPIEDTLFNEKGGRGFVVVADSREALIGTVYGDGSVEGGVSENCGFVTLAEDYIKHDVYIMKIVTRFDEELISRFGDNYALLRDIFSDREVTR